ncbi:MAG: transporter [Sphingomonadaceae bacterium]|nr:transporter [Sphingomonadaceae bacterium]
MHPAAYGLALAAIAVATSAQGQSTRDFCPDRPGLGTPACTLDAGQVAVEIGLVDWTHDRDGGNHDDQLLSGDMLLRYGISHDLELQWGWSLYGDVHSRSGALRTHDSGTGDMRVALRQNLHNPDGGGLSVAIMPYVSLPTGGSAIGAGDWGAGLLVPVSQELPGGYALALTASVEAAVDGDRNGRHLAYGVVAGVDLPLAERLGATVEISAQRDKDPAGKTTAWLGGLSLGWTAADALQFDVGANIGLNRQAADMQAYFGIAYRF